MSDFYAVQPLQSIKPYPVNTLGNGLVTVTVGACGLHRDTGVPSQPGDVLSVQPPNGVLQTRPAGTSGAYEQAVMTDKGPVYQPAGAGTPRFLIAGVVA